MSPASPADVARVWFRFIRLSQALSGVASSRLRQAGLSVPQFDVLSTLTEREGCTQRELAERLYVTKGNVSGLIDRLVEAGYVERRAIPGDRRSHALYLTAAGRTKAEHGMALHQAIMRETLGALSAQDVLQLDQTLVTWRDVVRKVMDGEDRART
ncbi:MAG TPA: MarR family winged helix-turn-helix transcriptional regulator [Beijerinckiaceae bacterium]|nr:MarR family winged helix-turn-helix transcriptional regulator [Beijerinckiaceae bacterium]